MVGRMKRAAIESEKAVIQSQAERTGETDLGTAANVGCEMRFLLEKQTLSVHPPA